MSQGVKITLTPEQESWLREHFATTKNAEIQEHLGIRETTLHRYARKLGLKKTPAFQAQCQRGAADAAKKWWRVEGRYRPKKGLPDHLREHQYRKGDKPWTRCGMEKWQDAVQRGSTKRRQTFREERARAHFGLEQRTKLHVTRQPREKVLARYYLKKLGYIIDEKNFVAYWNDDTVRAYRLEAKPRRFYTFKQLPA